MNAFNLLYYNLCERNEKYTDVLYCLIIGYMYSHSGETKNSFTCS